MVQGWIPARTETVDGLTEEARTLSERGQAWIVWGFDSVDDAGILAALADMGVELTRESFVELAEQMPGPYEMAEHWAQERFGSPTQGQLGFSLAARALWKRWLPERPTIEVEADELEVAMRETATKGASAKDLAPLVRFAAAVDGSEDVFDAIDAEQAMSVALWVLTLLREATAGLPEATGLPEAPDVASAAASAAEWVRAAEALHGAFPSDEVLTAAIANFEARNGAVQQARERLSVLIERWEPDEVPGTAYSEVALALLRLGDGDQAIEFAERRLRRADSGEWERAEGALLGVLRELNREGEAVGRINAVRVLRAADEKLRRKRRRRSAKGKVKRR